MCGCWPPVLPRAREAHTQSAERTLWPRARLELCQTKTAVGPVWPPDVPEWQDDMCATQWFRYVLSRWLTHRRLYLWINNLLEVCIHCGYLNNGNNKPITSFGNSCVYCSSIKLAPCRAATISDIVCCSQHNQTSMMFRRVDAELHGVSDYNGEEPAVWP